MTWKLYILNDTGLLFAEKYNEISDKQMTYTITCITLV